MFTWAVWHMAHSEEQDGTHRASASCPLNPVLTRFFRMSQTGKAQQQKYCRLASAAHMLFCIVYYPLLWKMGTICDVKSMLKANAESIQEITLLGTWQHLFCTKGWLSCRGNFRLKGMHNFPTIHIACIKQAHMCCKLHLAYLEVMLCWWLLLDLSWRSSQRGRHTPVDGANRAVWRSSITDQWTSDNNYQ